MSTWRKRKARANEKFLQDRAEQHMQRIGLAVLEERSCGECTACCTTNEIIAGLNKLGNVPCKHLAGNGCGIHDKRPMECRHYYCGYRRGMVEQRPDQCGLVVTFTPNAIVAAEVWRGAAVANKAMLENLQKQRGRVTVDVFLTPGQAVQAYARKMFPNVSMGTDDWEGFTAGMEKMYQAVSQWVA
ncbi:MAG TPA: hypothetical protein VE988_02145 [Gemmataceae bacterium]|nr:hypothetical protein [Gemmataceae bacterium]